MYNDYILCCNSFIQKEKRSRGHEELPKFIERSNRSERWHLNISKVRGSCSISGSLKNISEEIQFLLTYNLRAIRNAWFLPWTYFISFSKNVRKGQERLFIEGFSRKSFSEKSGKLLSYLIFKSRLHEDFTMAYSYKFTKLARQPFFQKEIYTAACSPILIVELNLHKLERNSGK